MSDPLSDDGIDTPERSGPDSKEFAAKLDALAVDAREPSDLLHRLTDSTINEDGTFDRDPIVMIAERALAYGIADDSDYPGAVALGVRFSSAGGDWPPAFDAVPSAEKSIWAAIAAEVEQLLPRAHFLDLVLSANPAAKRELADEVAGLYLKLGANGSIDPYYRGSCLRRSWSISRKFGLQSEADARKALYSMASSLVAMKNVPAGILLQPFESLVVPPRGGEFVDPTRKEVKDLVERVRPSDGTDTLLAEGVAELLERVAISDAERSDARRFLVNDLLVAATNSTGLLKVVLLQEVAEKARNFGFVDLRESAVQAMQANPVDDLELETSTLDFVMPRHFHDQRLFGYRRSRTSLDAFDLWLTTPSPTGDHDTNLKQASEFSGSSILQSVTRVTLSADGMPIRKTDSADDAVWEQLERAESISAAVYGALLANELGAIKAEYGVIRPECLAAHISEKFQCDSTLSLALGEALESFWDGRYSDAGRAAFPLVEAGARGLLLSLDDPLYRIQSGGAGGRFPSMEAYVERLEIHGFDTDWLRCLRNPVARLRNALAHGHRFQLSSSEAALLIRVAALLVVLTPAFAVREDRDQIESQLRDPIGWTGVRASLSKKWKRVWVLGPGSRRWGWSRAESPVSLGRSAWVRRRTGRE